MMSPVTTALDADMDALMAQAKRSAVIVLENGGGKDATFGTLALLLVVAAGWLIVTGGLVGSNLAAVMGSGLFFAGLALVYLRRWLVARARQLRLTPNGVELATLTAYYSLFWSQVGSVTVVPNTSIFPGRGDGAMLIAELTSKPDANQRTDVFGLCLFPLGRKVGFSATFGLTHEDLSLLLQTYRDTVLHAASPPPPKT